MSLCTGREQSREIGMEDTMKREERKALLTAFEAPEPLQKKAFLKKIGQPSISQAEFMLRQISYIRKWVWAVSVLILSIALMGALVMRRDMLWMISALMPFAALAALTENARSECYGMAELEQTSRFSPKSVALARMGSVGVSHLILLGLLMPLIHQNAVATVLQAGVYLLVPYLLTCVLGFWIVRRIRGSEGIFGCLAAAVLVSGMYFVFEYRIEILLSAQYFPWWSAAMVLLLTAAAREIQISIFRRAEDMAWN